jgi:hypothetical protein
MFPLIDNLISLALRLGLIKYQRLFRMSIPGNKDFSYSTKRVNVFSEICRWREEALRKKYQFGLYVDVFRFSL